MNSFGLVDRIRLPGAPSPASTAPRSPVELTLAALEGRYRALIVWYLFWSAKTFSDLMRSIPGITKKALRRELAQMERLGLLRRDMSLGGGRKADYSLTPLGQSLKPLVGAMYEWGLRRMSQGQAWPRLRALDPRPGA
jgi:DNA-binding HxlR family transcriptional regulator